MSSLPQPNDYSAFGFEPEQQNDQQPEEQVDYSTFGFEPEKPKEIPQPFKNIIEHFQRENVPQEQIDEYLAENSLNEFMSSKKTYKELPRGLAAGASFGLTKHIPGMKPEGYQGQAAEALGSFLPINLLAKGASFPLVKLAEKSPIIKNQLKAFADLVGISAAGGVYGGLEEATAGEELKLPSVDSMLQHGANWAIIDTGLKALGWGGRFSKALYNAVKESGKPVEEVLTSIAEKAGTTDKSAEKAISILEGKPLNEVEQEAERARKVTQPQFGERSDIEQRMSDLVEGKLAEPKPPVKPENIGKAEQISLDKINEKIPPQPKPYLPNEFEAEKLIDDIIDTELDEKIESVGKRASSEKELGENIQADIKNQIAQSKNETDALYKIAQDFETSVSPPWKKTANSLLTAIKKIESGGLKLSPEGYKKAKADLTAALEDLGYSITQDTKGLADKIIQDRPVNLETGIEVKKRLNNIIDYDLLETSAQDFLKTPAHELRQEIRKGYGNNRKAKKAFELAEEKFGEMAEKKGRKSIVNTRSTEKPESIAKTIRTPSGLQDIKNIVSPEQFSQIEREVLEYIKSLPEDKAANYYREIRQQLDDGTKQVAEEILQSKIPKGSPERKALKREKIQQSILDDIERSSLTGERPDKTLNLWKTEEGQQLVKNALKDNPHKQEVIDYLSDQSFEDFYTQIISPDKEINFKKFSEFLSDKATMNNLRMVAGEEGVTFFKQLDQLSKNLQKQKSIFEKTLSKSSQKELKQINEALTKIGEQRLQNLKSKIKAPSKSQEVFSEKIFSKDARKTIKESEESLTKLGEDRFARAKEKNVEARKAKEAFDKQTEKAIKQALEDKEKSSLLYKFDDILGTYGVKGKMLLTALGMFKFGGVQGLTVAIGYEVFKKMAKNKSVREAIRKAAGPKKDPTAFIYAVETMDKAIED